MRRLFVAGLIGLSASPAGAQVLPYLIEQGPRVEVRRGSPLLGPTDAQGRPLSRYGYARKVIVTPSPIVTSPTSQALRQVVTVERIEVTPVQEIGNRNMRRNEHASPNMMHTGSPCAGASATGFCN